MRSKEQLRINGLTLRNRIIMPPMATAKAINGAPGEGLVEDYYSARARGTGLVCQSASGACMNYVYLLLCSNDTLPPPKTESAFTGSVFACRE